MPRCSRFALGLGLVVAAFSAAAVDAPPESRPPAARPRIGLVLGGGGAKGAAHIGVIKVLEELRIPIDCIAGTSMGSIVGAAYATGLSAAQLEQTITAVNWRDILASAPREEIPVHRKQRDFAFTNGLEFGWKDGGVVAPGGIVPAHQIEALFQRIVAGAAHVPSFDRLPIPFRAVATDLETGEMVVFDRGELAVAMRASMAVPGAFAPVEHDGRLLVDGMLVRNLPVDVARRTCADVVIAVPVGNPRVTRAGLASFLGVAGQAMNIAIEANENAQMATLRDQDVLIKVTLKDVTSGDFNKVPEAIPIGEAAAREAAAALSRYSMTPQQYAEWRNQLRKVGEVPKVKIDEVRLRGLEVTNPEVMKSMLHTRPGDTYDPAKADADANRLVARGDFTSVGHSLDSQDGLNTLTYDAVEKPWGPDYLMFDVNLGTDFRGDTAWGIRVDYEKRWLNSLGGEFRTSMQLGRPNVLNASFYQPLDEQQRYFVSPSLYASQTLEYVYSQGAAVGQYDIRRAGGVLDVGVALDPWGEVRLGLLRGAAEWSSKIGSTGLPESGRAQSGALTASFIYDNIDKRLFPTHGSRATVLAYASSTALGASLDYQKVSFTWSTSAAFRRSVWAFGLRGGSGLNSDVPFYDQFSRGGLFDFSGYRSGELVGREFGLAVAQYRYRSAFLNETLGSAVYSGASLELGNVYKRLDGTPARGVLTSGSLFLAVDSKLGPLYLAYGMSEGGHNAVYFYFGSSLESYRP